MFFSKFLHRQYQKMFSKKCMVVGSLLVMAAQTATAVTCASITGSSDPTLAVLCGGAGYTGDLESPTNQNCDNTPCSGTDAAKCCVAKANCDTINGLSDPSLGEVCVAAVGYLEVLIAGAFCAGTTCQTSDQSSCCVPAVNCDTITANSSPNVTTVCGGGDDDFTGVLIAAADSTKCAGAACGLVDKSKCCVQKATCGTITADSSPSLATVCGGDPGYTEAIGSSSAKCAGATCGTSDKGTCCAEKSSAGDDGDDDDDDDDNKFSNTCTAPKKQCEGSHEYLSGFKGGCHSCDDGPESCADLVSMIKKGGCYAECAGKIVFFHPLFYVLI